MSVAPPVALRPGPALLLTLVGMAMFGFYMHWAQNIAGHQGGHISLEKVFWLCYAITAFIWMPLFFWLDWRTSPVLKRIYGAHLVLWAVRAAAELYLMYGVHLWIPPYGVAHNVVTILMLTFLAWLWRGELASLSDETNLNACRYLALMRMAMVCEITFAMLFYDATDMDTRTTWFANEGPRFFLINWLTRGADIVLYPLLAVTIYRYYKPMSG